MSNIFTLSVTASDGFPTKSYTPPLTFNFQGGSLAWL